MRLKGQAGVRLGKTFWNRGETQVRKIEEYM